MSWLSHSDRASLGRVQRLLPRLVEEFDRRRLLGPDLQEQDAFKAMQEYARLDPKIASLIHDLQEEPTIFLYMMSTPTLPEEMQRAARLDELVDEALPGDASPAEEVAAVVEVRHSHPDLRCTKSDPDPEKLGRVQSFLETLG